MQQVAGLAEQVRQNRVQVAPDNPLLAVQAQVSEAIVTTLERWGEMKDRSFEQIFLTLYGSPLLQALLGMRASDEPPRHRPGVEPERLAFVQQRIAEIRARVAEGGAREAALRSLVYVGMAGEGVDERAFNELRQIDFELIARGQVEELCTPPHFIGRDGAVAIQEEKAQGAGTLLHHAPASWVDRDAREARWRDVRRFPARIALR